MKSAPLIFLLSLLSVGPLAKARVDWNTSIIRSFDSEKDYFPLFNTISDPGLVSDTAQAFRSHVYILPSEISTFSYLQREKLNLKPDEKLTMANPQVRRLMVDAGTEFWNPDANLQLTVSGFYVAFIPAQTAMYGHEHPVLFQVNLPAGTRTLAVYTQPDKGVMNLDPVLLERLRAIGCPVDDGENRSNGWMATLVGASSSRQCKSLVRAVVRELKIEALVYPFFTEGSTCLTNSPNTAAILFPAPWVHPRVVKVYGPVAPYPDPYPEDRYAVFLFYPLLKLTHPEISPMWSSVPAPAGFDLTTWTRQHTWGCAPGYDDPLLFAPPIEEQPTPTPVPVSVPHQKKKQGRGHP